MSTSSPDRIASPWAPRACAAGLLLGLSLYAAANTAAHANAHERMLWWAASVLCFLTPLLLAWIIVLYREVRLRRAAEIALKDHAAIQSALLDGIPQPVYLRDASLRLITCNRSYEELVGTTRDALRGQGLEEAGHVHPVVTDMAEVVRDYRKVIEDGVPLHKDRCLQLGKRNHHVLNWLTPLRGADGSVKGLAGGCVDLTERLEMLAELAQAKTEAEAANRAKSTFLASVSHEIRTPMNAITGMLELTLARCQLSDDERLQLVTAHNSALGLLSLIDDILDLSKMEAGNFSIQAAPASLPALVQDTLLIFGPVAAQKGLPLSSEFGAGLAPLHQVDGLRLRQILANLISNAVRFTDSGTIRVRLDAQPACEGVQQVVLTVSDTGIGIGAEAQARLFEPFEQVHGRSRPQAGGTGLGLAICQRLVSAMGGQITLSSEAGKGTRVAVSLPLAIVDAADAAEAAAPAPPSEPMAGCARRHARILVIDDHAPNRLLLQRQLEHLGHQVTTACDGRDALAKLDAARFDMIVCDCAMPVMDGLAFTRAVRAREDAVCCVPVIGCTASAVAEDHQAALDAGMNAVIVKPVGLQALDEAVARACAGGFPPHRVTMPVFTAATGWAAGVPDDIAHCGAKPGSRPSWCAVCRQMNVQCDQLDPEPG